VDDVRGTFWSKVVGWRCVDNDCGDRAISMFLTFKSISMSYSARVIFDVDYEYQIIR